MKQILEKVYFEMIRLILKDVPENFQNEVLKSYREYLNITYLDNNKLNSILDDAFNIIIKIEKQKWSDKDLDYKLYYLVHDNSLNTIKEISQRAYSLAKERFANNNFTIDEVKANDDLKLLISELENVYDFNKVMAKELVSESILDIKYALGNNDAISFRLSKNK